MGIKDRFGVVSMPRGQAIEWLKYKHYAKSTPGIMYTFGLYESRVLIGVCAYGTPANNHNNVLGNYKCIELVRLVVNDGLEKNVLSYFVSNTFQLLPRPVVVISYADEGKGHHGYIYQATNWIYTGRSTAADSYIDRQGKSIHSRIMSDLRLKQPNKTRDEIARSLHWDTIKGTHKFRYFYFIGSKKEKKEMMKSLLERYSIEPYPKGDNERYDSSYKPAVQLTLFDTVPSPVKKVDNSKDRVKNERTEH